MFRFVKERERENGGGGGVKKERKKNSFVKDVLRRFVRTGVALHHASLYVTRTNVSRITYVSRVLRFPPLFPTSSASIDRKYK